ncbi:MAG: hypothetical protein QM820_35865 [Minicystis sp.]
MLSSSKKPRTRSICLATALAAVAAVSLVAAPASAQEPPRAVYHVPPSFGLAGPVQIDDWSEGEPVPLGYHPIKRMRTPLVVAGSVTFGATYLLTALGGAIASDAGNDHAASLLVPIAGPFIMIGGTRSATGSFGLVIDGLAQAAGVTMLVVGLAMPKAVLKRNDLGKIEITPTPMQFGSSGGGFGIVGRF